MISPLEDSHTYKWVNGIIYNSLSFLAFTSHLRAMLTDPVRKIVISIYSLYLHIVLMWVDVAKAINIFLTKDVSCSVSAQTTIDAGCW